MTTHQRKGANKVNKPESPVTVNGAEKSKTRRGVELTGLDAWVPHLVAKSHLGGTRKLHDKWNMMMLPMIVLMVFDGIIRRPETTFQPYVILFYFIVDTSWLVYDSGCVRSPFEILVHHLACLGIAVLNFTVVPEFWTLWPWAIVVEVNTVFLIGQRVVPEGILRLLARIVVIVTWFPCRFAVPSYMSYVAYKAALNNRMHTWQIVLAIITMSIIFVMQVMWTHRLFSGSMVRDVLAQLRGQEIDDSKDSNHGKVLNEGL